MPVKHTKEDIMKYCYHRWRLAQGYKERELFYINVRLRLNPEVSGVNKDV